MDGHFVWWIWDRCLKGCAIGSTSRRGGGRAAGFIAAAAAATFKGYSRDWMAILFGGFGIDAYRDVQEGAHPAKGYTAIRLINRG